VTFYSEIYNLCDVLCDVCVPFYGVLCENLPDVNCYNFNVSVTLSVTHFGH